jgi:ABC-type sugar transport system ATPase subunit
MGRLTVSLVKVPSQDQVNVLEIRGLSKTFGTQRALSDIDLDVRAGEIHALIGENGCGKSTLVKCLSGYHQPDPGAEVRVRGRRLPALYGPEHASAFGLTFVHQDLGLIGSLSVTANLLLGGQVDTGFGWRLRKRREFEAARKQLALLNRADIHPRELVADLSIAAQTTVAIARCLYHAGKSGVMVLDEPTASLAEDEAQRLFKTLRRAAAEGHGIIYISHRLEELYALADRVTVLRDGARVATRTMAELPRSELVELIVGRPTDVLYPSVTSTTREDVVLRAQDLTGAQIRGVSLSVRKGEILGVAGLLGCGKSELGRLLFGVQPLASGHIALAGRSLSLRSPGDAIRQGIAMVPADRHRNGVHINQSVADNITFLDVRKYWRQGWLRNRERILSARPLMDEYDVRPRDPKRSIALLSGGNQQKAVLAKWMHREPQVLILDEPAHGIDIGAKSQVFSLVEDAARSGTAVIIISEEFEDLARLCDRVLVMRDGRIAAELEGNAKTRRRISELVYGLRVEA